MFDFNPFLMKLFLFHFKRLAKPIKRTNLTDRSIESPGPGQYKIKEQWNDGPKIIFGEKLDQKVEREEGFPGPAEYKIKERTENPSYSY